MGRISIMLLRGFARRSSWEAVQHMNDIEDTLKYALDKDRQLNLESLKDYSNFLKPKPELKFRIITPLLYSLFRINLEKEYENKLRKWETEKEAFLSYQKHKNAIVDELQHAYIIKKPNAIINYCELVLLASYYYFRFEKDFEIDYNPESQVLIVEYLLPSIDKVPNIKELKYTKTRGCKEIYYSETQMRKIYDNLLYQISLRSIYELFNADITNVINAVAFNGLVRTIDKSTGHEVVKCILSIFVRKDDFMNINLLNVDPKECFKKFKGVSASKLHDLIPIAPIMHLDKHDKRFISAYGVAASLDETINIAVMDWQDFEHLIREILEREFQQNGGEVKITRASRDAGVDAIAFDPDPIRGGKIVIQAKRYVNIVGVAAVRDLYGTVINEGATKGILVTTSNYGAEAYEFAKQKPIALLNGSNLLHLLEKHGYRAKIDLIEAKRLLAEKEYK